MAGARSGEDRAAADRRAASGPRRSPAGSSGTIVEVLEKSKAPLGDQADAVATALTGPLADDFKVDGGLVKKR